MTSRRAAAAVVTALLATLAMPSPAGAHGLFLTPALPIPVWLFAVIAGTLVVASFVAVGVLWSSPLLAERGWRPTRLSVGRALRGAAEFGAGALGVLVLALVAYSGLAGAGASPAQASHNFAALWVFVIFWAGLPLAQVIAGDLFEAFNPWRAIGRAAAGLARLYVRPARGQDLTALLRYPTWLGRLPAVAGLLGFAFLELCSSRSPEVVGQATLVYTGWTLLGMTLFGVDAWLRQGETFSVYLGLYGRMSLFEWRQGRLGLRRPLSALADLAPARGTVALLAVMIGAVSYDGASGTVLWQRFLPRITDALASVGFGPIAAQEWASFTGVLLFSAAAGALYRLGVLGAGLVTRARAGARPLAWFAPSLVPIAAAYLLAHNLTLLVIGGQNLVPAISDPLGDGSNLLGTRDFVPDDRLLPAEAFWYLEVGAIVLGHAAAIALAHDLALRIYDRAREAVRSQLSMLLVMVVYSVSALWLLKEASEL